MQTVKCCDIDDTGYYILIIKLHLMNVLPNIESQKSDAIVQVQLLNITAIWYLLLPE